MSRIAAAVLAISAALGTAQAADASHSLCHRDCRVHAPQRDAEGIGTQTDPMFVHNQPNTTDGGGSWAWADYGQRQVLRASKPSPAAHAICQLDALGDTIWVSGGMLLPGQYQLVQEPPPWQPWNGGVGIMVLDPDGSHGGNCSPIGMNLVRVA